jgi:toxin YoeB
MKIAFSSEAFLDFQNWSREDKKLFSKICAIIKGVERSPFHGLGKPEPLKHTLSGFWSRRINQEHRLVYKVEKDTIFIASCKYHY